MPSTATLSITKLFFDVVTRLTKARVRLHNTEALTEDMAILFTVNHFTRLETLLLPYFLYKATGREVMGLAAAELFQGRVGDFLKAAGAVSTKAPDRDRIIIKSLLDGSHPWMIFPEGAMIKDKKVVDHRGQFAVYNNGARRPPHKGAAALALRTEFYRHKLGCLIDHPDPSRLEQALAQFDLDRINGVLEKRTVVVPVNITYYPIRAHDNLFLRFLNKSEEGLSPRAIDELSVEGTVLAEDTDIDIRLGEPIEIAAYLERPEYASVMACGLDDMKHIEMDPRSLFNDATRELTQVYMREIYQLTTLNPDHLFAAILQHLPEKPFSESLFKKRAWLCASHTIEQTAFHRHPAFESLCEVLVSGEQCPAWKGFRTECEAEGLLKAEGKLWIKSEKNNQAVDFHTVRSHQLAQVIANEAEPLRAFSEACRRFARMSAWRVNRRVRSEFLQRDQALFEEEYARFFVPQSTKGPDVGRPFLLRPWRPKAGVLLAHGYMAAPLEVRGLADFLYAQGYAVYGVRLRGHGTDSADLAGRTWQEWYTALDRGYAVLDTLTDDIYLGGFSTGGCLALLAATRKEAHIRGVFSICAPLKLQNYSVHLAPSIVSLNALLRRIGANRSDWEYVENHPENKHINYLKNPLTGIKELVTLMNVTERSLGQVLRPTLVIQAHEDPTVNPESAELIFNKVGATDKEVTFFARSRHGIINHEGREDIFYRVLHWLQRVPCHPEPALDVSDEAVEAALPEATEAEEEGEN